MSRTTFYLIGAIVLEAILLMHEDYRMSRLEVEVKKLRDIITYEIAEPPDAQR